MPHFFFGSSLFFGSRSQSSGDCIQDVSFCNQQDLGASWAISPRSLASLPPLSRLSPASLPPLSASNCLSQPQFDPLDLNPVCLRCRHSALERSSPPGSCLNSDGLKGFRPPVSCPCLLPLSLAPVSCPCLLPLSQRPGSLVQLQPTNLPSASSALFHRLRQGTNAAFFLFQG